MITTRLITLDDYPIISDALEYDEYHKGGEPEFFYKKNTCCNVYEDERGPIFYLRGSIDPDVGVQAICIDIQFVSNNDTRRNMEALLVANNVWVPQCKEQGFKELVFNTNSPKLKRFCTKYLGFADIDGKMRKTL
jgi:hypothetical protein